MAPGGMLLEQGLRDRGDLGVGGANSTLGWKNILMMPKPL